MMRESLPILYHQSIYCLFEIFISRIFQLIHSGYIEKLKAKWWSPENYDKNCQESDDVANEISIRNIGGLFVLILIGIWVSSLILLFEFYWFKYFERPKILAAANRILIQRRILRRSTVGRNVEYKLYNTI